MNSTQEENSIKGLSRGDKKSFELLFLHHQPALVNFLRGFIKDSEQARDMAQDIFLNVWHNREKLGEIHSFKAYLFKMAKNAVCNYYDHLLVNDKFEARQMTQPEESENIEEALFAKELQVLIETAVCKMPTQRKLIYTMSRIEGINNNDIAEKLHITKRTVENHLTAALADVRKMIKVLSALFL